MFDTPVRASVQITQTPPRPSASTVGSDCWPVGTPTDRPLTGHPGAWLPSASSRVTYTSGEFANERSSRHAMYTPPAPSGAEETWSCVPTAVQTGRDTEVQTGE